MKNLFDFATRELSQDAFLRWMFENYDEPELMDAAGNLLKEFCGIGADEIEKLATTAQWCNIDISVWITLKNGKKAALFIEDKTCSEEHYQLGRYDAHIRLCENEYDRIYKIFYKTDVVGKEERERIAKTEDENKWRIYSIKEILPLFEKYTAAGNLILRQYAEHVVGVYRATENTAMPDKNNTGIDYLKWISFFEKAVVPRLSEDQGQCEYKVTKAGQYPYVYISIWKSGYNKVVPTLELRSRDCLPVIDNCSKRYFNVRFLCYGIPPEDVVQQQTLIEKIESSGHFETKGMVRHRNGKERYYPKQIGYLPKTTTVENEEEFFQKLKEYIGYYLELMQDWK